MLGFRLSGWLLLSLATAHAERITINQTADGHFQVVSDKGAIGDRGTIRGAGGWGRLEAAKAYGADAMRTWHIGDLHRAVPEAEAQGLKISVGIWLTHSSSHYENCTDLEADMYWQGELQSYLPAVRRYKNSSAILWWTVGNEVELGIDVEAGTDCVWRRVDWFARAVKAEDPSHPVGTVLAGAHEDKVRNIGRLCDSLDFLGINTYGESSLTVGTQLLSAGWRKPYAIMEFGPRGHWEAPLTVWDAYIEESSTQKVPRYLATCNSCQADKRCIGSFAFVWGWKWEKTGTWYGMFNEWPAVTEGVGVNCTGCESETVAIMEECWSGVRRANPAPSLQAVQVGDRRLPGMRFSIERDLLVPLRVEAHHALGHNLTALWAVTEEIVSDAVGGAFEATNALVSGLWQGSAVDTALGLSVVLNTSALPASQSAYRLYIFVREDPEKLDANQSFPLHEASATLPFHTCRRARPGEECFTHVEYAMQSGIHADPGSYAGLNPSSSFEEFQMVFYQKGVKSCPLPCGLEEWCHTAVRGEQCHAHVSWALREGIHKNPSIYTGLTDTSTFAEAQKVLYEMGIGLCTRPCPHRPGSEHRDEQAQDSRAESSNKDGQDGEDPVGGSSALAARGGALLASLWAAVLAA